MVDRTLHSLRLEEIHGEIVLVVTASIGSELIIEQCGLGPIDVADLAAQLDAAVRELQNRISSPLVPAA